MRCLKPDANTEAATKPSCRGEAFLHFGCHLLWNGDGYDYYDDCCGDCYDDDYDC